jgi:hypothetical protein
LFPRLLVPVFCGNLQAAGHPSWALLGLWLGGFERLISPKETLKSSLWEAEIGTQETLSLLRGCCK